MQILPCLGASSPIAFQFHCPISKKSCEPEKKFGWLKRGLCNLNSFFRKFFTRRSLCPPLLLFYLLFLLGLLVMSDLRHRPLSAAKKHCIDKEGLIKTNGYIAPAISTTTSAYFYVIIILGAVTLSALTYTYLETSSVSVTAYALCSRDGHSVYTVDAKNARTQCLVVHNSMIVDTGSLGKIFCRSLLLLAEVSISFQRTSRSAGIILRWAST